MEWLIYLKERLSPVVTAVGTLGLGVDLALKDHIANIANIAGVTDFGDSSVNLIVRAWTDNSNYRDVYFYINETL